jgi:hypothetical protein
MIRWSISIPGAHIQQPEQPAFSGSRTMRKGTPFTGHVTAAALTLACGVMTAQAQFTNGTATGTSIQVQTLTTGNTLEVGGAVSADGRYVTMNVDPQLSSLDSIDTFVVPGNGTVVGGSSNGAAGIFLPAGTQAIGIRRVPYRPAQIGPVLLINKDDRLLVAKVPHMSLKETSLQDAIRKIAQASGKNIVLGIRALEEEGVNTASPRDFEIQEGTVRSAIFSILRTATGDLPMVVTSEENVVTVVTQSQADNEVITRHYYLDDLLGNIGRWMAGGTDLGDIPSRFGIGAKSTDLSSPPDPAEYGKPTGLFIDKEKAKAPPISTNIADLITSTVRPEIWKVNGGKIGEIGVAGNIVVIRAPRSVHVLLDGPRRYDPNRVPLYVGYKP